MKNGKSVGFLMAVAFAAAYASTAGAQPSPETHPGATRIVEGGSRNLPDMRLWSFGDCDNKFPYVNSDEHKECVRVVGSEEARDARAYKICETSNARDPEEVARCKSTYKANKDRSAQSGITPNAVAQAPAPPTADELKRVRAIVSAAVENDRAAAQEAAQATAASAPAPAAVAVAAPAPADDGDEKSSIPFSLVVVLSIFAVGGGSFAVMQRRKQPDFLSPR